MIRRVLCSVLCLLCLTRVGGAWADPQAKQRYDLKIILHVERHPLLTDVFKDRLQRELGDWLQESLGELARVTVEKPDAAMAKTMEKGLQNLQPLADRSGAKSHFVLVRYLDGQCEIQTRQFDSLTGLMSPARADRTRSRDIVPKSAALMVQHDFGIVGTYNGQISDKAPIKLVLKGGELGVPMDRWVKEKEVFAVVPVQADGSPGTRLEWALLRVTEAPAEGSGTCVCQLYHRNVIRPSPSGYRFLKLGTTEGPLRIRIYQQAAQGQGKPLEERLELRVSATGFEDEKAPIKGEVGPNQNGVFDTSSMNMSFKNMAFVRIKLNPTDAIVPIEILDDGYLDVRVNAVTEKGNQRLFVLLAFEGWQREIVQNAGLQANLFQEILKMASKPAERAAALGRAKAGLERFRSTVADLRRRGEELRSKKLDGKPLDLTSDFARLKAIEEGTTRLATAINDLEESERKANSPEMKKAIEPLTNARLAAEAHDFDRALMIYDELHELARSLEDKTVLEKETTEADRIRELWKLRGPGHKEAREYVTQKFPGLALEDLANKTKIDELKSQVEILKTYKDVFTLDKLMTAIDAHAEKLTAKREGLKPGEKAEDRITVGLIKDASEALAPLRAEIAEFLQKNAPK